MGCEKEEIQGDQKVAEGAKFPFDSILIIKIEAQDEKCCTVELQVRVPTTADPLKSSAVRSSKETVCLKGRKWGTIVMPIRKGELYKVNYSDCGGAKPALYLDFVNFK